MEWATLQAIANTKAIDVWFLFSLSGLYRQAARSSEDITEEKRLAIPISLCPLMSGNINRILRALGASK